MSKRLMKRRKGIYWDYNYDGVFRKERIKGFWKKYWQHWSRRTSKLEIVIAGRGGKDGN